MASPVANSYSGASGATIYCGRSAPGALPAWASAATLNKAIAIPNSSGAGGSALFAFSGFSLRPDTGELFCLANGGHGDSSDNRVTSFPLMNDSPAWVLRCAATPSGQRVQDTAYYLDGLPTSRHTYDGAGWVSQIGRFVMAGWRGGYGNAYNGGDTCAFDPVTNTWDAAGTWLSVPSGYQAFVFDPSRGNFWSNAWHRVRMSPNAIDQPISTHPVAVRFPSAYDSARDQLFSLQWADSFGGAPRQLNASKWSAAGTGSQVAVTFNASAAYTQFLSEEYIVNPTAYSQCHAMAYDSANDCFYWYNGRLTQAGHLYVIRPNATAVWDMELFSWASGSAILPNATSSGINGRLKYVALLNGFVICPDADGSIYYVRTS